MVELQKDRGLSTWQRVHIVRTYLYHGIVERSSYGTMGTRIAVSGTGRLLFERCIKKSSGDLNVNQDLPQTNAILATVKSWYRECSNFIPPRSRESGKK